MKLPSFVCPANSLVFGTFSGRSVVCQTTGSLREIAEIVGRVRVSGNNIHCIIATLDRPLAETDFPDCIKNVPLAVRCPSVGRYADISRSLPKLRDFNMRLYLPADCQDNITAIQMLSSLGLHCCAEFGDGAPYWEGLAELASYAMLSRCDHGPIEPFAFIASHFVPHRNLDWGRAVFDDPEHYLHLDREGRIALTARDLAQGKFIAEGVVGFSPKTCPQMAEHRHRWRDFFRDDRACASCPGWRLCLGRFADHADESAGCSAFFTELTEVATEHYRLKQAASKDALVWQP